MIFAFFFYSFFSFSNVTQDNVSLVSKLNFSFKTVCSKMLMDDSPLIEVVSGTELDCMGRKILVSSFCEKQLPNDPYYIRSYIDNENYEVVCVSGKKVLFKYQCVKLSDHYLCSNDPKKSCLEIQHKLAKRLDLIHFSVMKNEKGIRELNCYFDSDPEK